MQRVIHSPGGPFGPGPRGFGRIMFNGGPGGLGIVRFIFMIGFVLLLAIVAYLLIRHFDRNQQHHHSHVVSTPSSTSADNAASEVLKMRFAKGEIDEDEFTRRMNLLKEHQSVS